MQQPSVLFVLKEDAASDLCAEKVQSLEHACPLRNPLKVHSRPSGHLKNLGSPTPSTPLGGTPRRCIIGVS